MKRPVFDPLQLQSALLDVQAASHAPATALIQRQRMRLQQLLAAAQGSRLYRERMHGLDGAADFPSIAPVTRGELMARFDDWVTDPALRLEDLQALTRDPARAGEAWLGRYVVWESSGTSGQPGIFVQDARAMAVYDALEATRQRPPSRAAALPFWPLGALGALGGLDWLGASDRHALVTATGGHFASTVSFERLRAINPWLALNARSFNVLQALDALVPALNAFQPSVLATYPTAAAVLADEALAGRLRIAPRCVMMGGESVSQAVRQHVAHAFRAVVRSSYGTSEFLPIAWECAHGRMHVNADWVLLEPVDEQQRPVATGQRSDSVLLTNLANTVQPLIRYDLGDRITWHGPGCACGSALPVIEVQGRHDDVMHVPACQGGRTVALLPLALCTVLEEECGVFDFQLRQQGPATLVLRLGLHGEHGAATVERCRDALQRFARAQGAEPLRILAELGCPLPRGRSGKACRVALGEAA
ncbi:MAG: phenylacetate--CoA ligase family protein [Burkholderiaceae bacterium]